MILQADINYENIAIVQYNIYTHKIGFLDAMLRQNGTIIMDTNKGWLPIMHIEMTEPGLLTDAYYSFIIRKSYAYITSEISFSINYLLGYLHIYSSMFLDVHIKL